MPVITEASDQTQQPSTSNTMEFEAEFRAIEKLNASESQRIIFSILANSLRSTADMQRKAANIVEEISTLLKDAHDGPSPALWDLWMVLVDIVYVIPTDHPWQDTLVETLQLMRYQEGHIGNVINVG
jgi:hypothetical protein